jgi:hypothetical protein
MPVIDPTALMAPPINSARTPTNRNLLMPERSRLMTVASGHHRSHAGGTAEDGS